MQRLKIKQISLAVCLALIPFSSFAAGLGRLSVDSGLGEPFKAEIELLSVSPEESSTLAAAIASEEAYAEQGITRLGIHNNIKVEVTKNSAGEPILRLRSSQAISDPYLDMLIQLDWASGRLQREYTILLDPPGYKPQADVAVPTELPAVNSPSANTPPLTSVSPEEKTSSTKKLSKKSNPIDTGMQQSTDSASARPAATKYGDTLYSMAKELQVEGVSLDQMLIGLYESNQQAFSGNNMNRLKVGQIIKVPSKETLSAVTTQQASQKVKIHTENWNAYRDSLAAKVAAASATQEAEQKQAVSGKIGTAADKSIAAQKGPQDVVKLSAGEKGAKDALDSAAKINMLQDESAARDKSLKDSQERTAVLEKQILDMQKLLALKNQAMSEAQKTAAQAVATSKAVPIASTAAVAEKPASPSALEPSLWTRIINFVDLTLLSAIASITLLAAAWMILRNKRRKDLDSFERGILTSGGLNSSTVFGNTSGRNSNTDTSFLTDFVRSADGSMIDTHDVDPIAEAEVYMAYGRDAQAEEILKDAISKEPKRYELQLKLLEMYAAKKDTSAFEAVAAELYSTLGADDATWKKVAAIGLAFDPENSMYNVDKAVVATPAEKLDVSDFAADASVDNGLDFSVDIRSEDVPPAADANAVVQQSFSTAQDIVPELAFDLGSVEAEAVDVDVKESLAASDDAIAQSPLEQSQVTEEIAAQNELPEENINPANLSTPEISQEELSVATDNSLDFDVSELNAPKIESLTSTKSTTEIAPVIEPAEKADDNIDTNVLDLSAMNTNAGSEENNFDMDFDVPAEASANSLESLEQKSELVADAIQDISFDFEAEEPVKAVVAEPETSTSDLSFDLSENDEYVLPEVPTQQAEPRANELDLSSISFDLDDAPSVENAAAGSAQAVTEPPEVEIKLDLVAAYMDMGDKEGARELLEEVMKEGSEQQQLRAEKLISSLS